MRPKLDRSSMIRSHSEDEDSDDDSDEAHVEWSNLIFLPFHPVFKLLVLFSVIIKSTLGPIQSVFPIVYCGDEMEHDIYSLSIKYFYWYFCDVIYGIDTFLHIIHRQDTETAMRREHLPKSLFLILVDLVSLIPFHSLVANDSCHVVQFWPSILSFTEFFVLYRVVEYFSLVTTHSLVQMIIGFTIMLCCILNCVSCFWILVTTHHLCEDCRMGIIDWRNFFKHKLHDVQEGFLTYVYSTLFVSSFVVNRVVDETKPSTMTAFVVVSALAIFGYLMAKFIVFPKALVEASLAWRQIFTYYPQVKTIVAETKRRNPQSKAHIEVEEFFRMIWKKRSGIIQLPEILSGLPRYMRIDLKQDLVWPVFLHSPILRKTSEHFKRMFNEYIVSDYKLPGEKLYSGIHFHSNLCYLKSGVVQLLSADDEITPIISLTSGTLLGDVSFHLPHYNCKVITRCLTFCEIMYITRLDYIRVLHKYPEDRRNILALVKDRIKHARALYVCKHRVKGLDRTEDEGIVWVKSRWWEISNTVNAWRKRSNAKEHQRYKLPPEETVYHCAKYIGQLVLCDESQLQTKSLFVKADFPWILRPNSSFASIWYRVVTVTVFLVLLLYPPNIASVKPVPAWFNIFQYCSDLVYIADVCVSLLTEISRQDSNSTISFTDVLFARCRSLHFFLDVLASIWTEYIAIAMGFPQLFNIAKFNRLIKVYKLFTGNLVYWDLNMSPMAIVSSKIIKFAFCFVYILSYVMYSVCRLTPDLTTEYFFGNSSCESDTLCEPGEHLPMGIAEVWTLEYLLFPELLAVTLKDIYFGMLTDYATFLFLAFCNTQIVGAMYLKYRGATKYQDLVTNLKKYYNVCNIHKDLLHRLDRYLYCHWKYDKGVDIMHPNMMKTESFDIYWKVQGELSEKIIRESRAFFGADPVFIREIAYASKLFIVPRNATLFLFGVQSEKLAWIVQGSIRCEFHNEEDELLKQVYGPGDMLSACSVFLNKPSLRSYSACTDCEILYIRMQDFLKIIKRYPNESNYLKNCIEEYGPAFDVVFENYSQKHREYLKKLRNRVFHARQSVVERNITDAAKYMIKITSTPEIDFSTDPESRFMKTWFLFRALIVIISIVCASLQGGSGAVVRYQLVIIGAFCDCIALIDIILKLFVSSFCDCIALIDIILNLFLSYYDERGLLITSKWKCLCYYITRGFLPDMIGMFPWFELIRGIMRQRVDDDTVSLINTACKFAHLYIVLELFNYIGDSPNINSSFVKIFKWQLIAVLIWIGETHILTYYCIDFTFDSNLDLIHMQSKNSCWLPYFMENWPEPTAEQLHILYAESLNLPQSGLIEIYFGRYSIGPANHGVAVALTVLSLVSWIIMCYSLTLLVLNSRGNTIFQHGVSQLAKFLAAERVEKKLIDDTTTYFIYWWQRTKGINIHKLTYERIGVVLRQDLNYFFFQKTFRALDTLLDGGEAISRQLASVSMPTYVLPGQEIIREDDIVTKVYVVHRGKVIISQDGEKIVTLTKGCIFGHLFTSSNHPGRSSAMTEDYADLLAISIGHFQDIINDKIRERIAKNPQSKDDYMKTKKHFEESTYDSIQYLLHVRKTIKLPGMVRTLEIRTGNWYSIWLWISWLIVPLASAALALYLGTIPPDILPELWPFFIIWDMIVFANFVMEFFTLEQVVVDDMCVQRILGLRRFKRWTLYVDAVALLFPMLVYVTLEWKYRLFALIRLRLLYDFEYNFCRNFKSRVAPVLMKVLLVLLLLHAMACGWIYVACRDNNYVLNMKELTETANSSIDRNHWVLPTERKGGCARRIRSSNPDSYSGYVVPKRWQDDYVVAITYIILLQTGSRIVLVEAVSLLQIYYKVCILFIMYFIDLWILNIAIGYIVTKLRELYRYDYNVKTLITYLRQSEISPALLDIVSEYTTQLWQRQRGTWLPELAHQAPICLREDLFCALYVHHLETPPLFSQLPRYMIRQLATRLRRIVIFPGKTIVQEGDLFGCIYFVHEGEVEKWMTNKNGENRMMILLRTNGYFGLLPGLYSDVAFQFTYCTRTVVDLVYLRLQDWQDLLDAYPDVKHNLYKAAKNLKKDFGIYT